LKNDRKKLSTKVLQDFWGMFLAAGHIYYKLLYDVLRSIWQAVTPYTRFSGERQHLAVLFVKYILTGRKTIQQSTFILLTFPHYP